MRRADWEIKLKNALDLYDGLEFKRARTDCVAFVGACVSAMTNVDPTAEIRGRYKSLGAAMQLISGRTFEEVAAEIAAAANLPEVPPHKAQRGDVVLVDSSGDDPDGFGHSIGVVDLTGAAALVRSPETHGLHRIPRGDRWVRAWRV